MSSDTYTKIEDNVGHIINQAAWEEVKRAGAEEARLARECGNIDSDGTPTIAVIADATNIEDLQRATSKQSGSTVWKQERRKRLTASLFGAICKRKPTAGCGRTVGDILCKEITSEAIRNGKDHECLALKQIENECNVVVKECGLFVDQESPFLGASPDGLIGEDVLVEVKCPYSARHLTPLEGVRAKKITCCEENKNGRLQLKTNSNYWYQVQGQLNIARRRKCLFVLWTKKGISTEVISRNQSFWEDEMLPRLKKFYMHCLLPELVDPRRSRGLPIRQPDYILEAQNTRTGAHVNNTCNCFVRASC
ncbi:uncharacterized protein LOC144122934 [Amblyomma americanum]